MLNWDFTNVGKISYFDSMTQFDFVTSFPALLRVESRGSMAHGRVSCPSLIVGGARGASTIFKGRCSESARNHEQLNFEVDIQALVNQENKVTCKVWGLLPLELWQQEFHDKAPLFSNYKEGVAL